MFIIDKIDRENEIDKFVLEFNERLNKTADEIYIANNGDERGSSLVLVRVKDEERSEVHLCQKNDKDPLEDILTTYDMNTESFEVLKMDMDEILVGFTSHTNTDALFFKGVQALVPGRIKMLYDTIENSEHVMHLLRHDAYFNFSVLEVLTEKNFLTCHRKKIPVGIEWSINNLTGLSKRSMHSLYKIGNMEHEAARAIISKGFDKCSITDACEIIYDIVHSHTEKIIADPIESREMLKLIHKATMVPLKELNDMDIFARAVDLFRCCGIGRVGRKPVKIMGSLVERGIDNTPMFKIIIEANGSKAGAYLAELVLTNIDYKNLLGDKYTKYIYLGDNFAKYMYMLEEVEKSIKKQIEIASIF